MIDDRVFVAVDVGTTKIRVCLFDASDCRILRCQEDKLRYVVDRLEIDPNELWSQFRSLVEEAVAHVSKRENVLGLGISCQRNTFITWDRETLKSCHNFITWKDERGRHFCEVWNRSFTFKLLNIIGAVGNFLTRGWRLGERFKAARMFKFVDAMVAPRFMETLKKSTGMQDLVQKGRLALGCIDSYLLSRMTMGAVHATEASNASSTGLYDPFVGGWGTAILKLIGFPIDVLPEIVEVDGCSPMAMVDEAIFGFPLPLYVMLGDSQAAALGSGCITGGRTKISLGTGSFVDCITGQRPHSSMEGGVYPLVGWRIAGDSTHLLEGKADATSQLFEWAQSIGLYDRIEDTSTAAAGANFDPNLLFTPTTSSGAPYTFTGIRPTTTRCEMLRAVMESIAFEVARIWGALDEESGETRNTARCCGGIALNDFICQQLADLLDTCVERVERPDVASARGVALLSGVAAGVWKMDDIDGLVAIDTIFHPTEERSRLQTKYKLWTRERASNSRESP